MKRIILAISLTALFFSLAACSKFNDVADSTKKQQVKGLKIHGEAPTNFAKPPKTAIADALKKSKLTAYPHKSVGEAFDAYSKVAAKEWREDIGRDGKLYVDYICWLNGKGFSAAISQDAGVKTGLDVKFVIQENGDAYIAMASKLSMTSDGKVQSTVLPLPEVARIVDAIYNNRELDL